MKVLPLGGGLDMGYAWALSTKWNLEAQIGGSYLWSSYYKSRCKTCAMRTGIENKGYFLPTRAALSLVYLF